MRFKCLFFAILLCTGLLFLIRLGDRGVVSEELRWAEVAREMDLTGDYFWPTINGRLYYDKPLGSYWLVLAASKITGEVNEYAARLPAAIAGCLGVLVLMLVARRLYDDRTALIAGAILATSFGFAFYARRASADVETVTGVLLAFALYAVNPARPGFWKVLLLWFIMAVTSQTKGLLGFVLPILILSVDGFAMGLQQAKPGTGIFRRWLNGRNINPWFRHPATLLAAPAAFALFLAPFAISALENPSSDGLALLYRENLQRFFAPRNHTGPIYLYAEVIFAILAPWSLLLPSGLLQLHAKRFDNNPKLKRGETSDLTYASGYDRSQTSNESDRLLKVYFWTIFIFFTLSASRRSYYLLPILPPAALLIARLLATPSIELSKFVRRSRNGGIGLFAGGIVVAGLGLLPPTSILPASLKEMPEIPGKFWFGMGWLLCLSGILAALIFKKIPMTPVLATTAFLGLGYFFLLALPGFENLRGRRAFACEVREFVQSDVEGLLLFQSSDIVFDLRYDRALSEARTPEELKETIIKKEPRWIVVPRKALDKIDFPNRIIAEESGHRWERPEQHGLKLLLLERRSEDISTAASGNPSGGRSRMASK